VGTVPSPASRDHSWSLEPPTLAAVLDQKKWSSARGEREREGGGKQKCLTEEKSRIGVRRW
jgi:hypothetical protein